MLNVLCPRIESDKPTESLVINVLLHKTVSDKPMESETIIYVTAAAASIMKTPFSIKPSILRCPHSSSIAGEP